MFSNSDLDHQKINKELKRKRGLAAHCIRFLRGHLDDPQLSENTFRTALKEGATTNKRRKLLEGAQLFLGQLQTAYKKPLNQQQLKKGNDIEFCKNFDVQIYK